MKNKGVTVTENNAGNVTTHGQLYLVDHGKSGEKVYFERGSISMLPKEKFNNAPYRSSPIFALSPNEAVEPDFSTASYIYFFFVEHPFKALGELFADLDPVIQKHIWFSYGLASLLLIAYEEDYPAEVIKTIQAHISGFEIWEITTHSPKIKDGKYPTPIEYDSDKFAISNKPKLDSYCLEILDDISQELHNTLALAARYNPFLLKLLESIASTVNILTDELNCYYHLYYTDEDPIESETLSMGFLRHLKGKKRRLQERINQHLGHLHQIAASLPYVRTQCFSGVLPILKKPGPSISHSLLGTGTAYNALASLAMFVEKTLHQHPITKYIRDVMPTKEAAKK